MAEFFMEILSEEIPARMQLRAIEDVKKLMGTELHNYGLHFSNLEAYVTPRRLSIVVSGLNSTTQGTVEERRGPKIGAPEDAIQGFLKSTGMTLENCEQRDGYYYAKIETQPRQTPDIIPEIVQTIFTKMAWPKSMFWALESGGKSQFWVRAVRSVLCLFDGQVICFELPNLGLFTGNQTVGHRFLAPQPFEVSSFEDYRSKLEKAYVVLDHTDRQTLIWQGLEALAKENGLKIQSDDGLLNEVAGLVEYPVPILGKIDNQFMTLPSPVLSTSMRVHQKYFTLCDKNNHIAPYFGVVANTKAADGGAKMIAGYERVLRARLSDAAFFYDQDVKIPLHDFAAKLHDIVFQAKLGNLHQKSQRLEILMLAQGFKENGKRAANLAKADLLTSMVGEFPELQGVMGEIYANAQGESKEVAAAIREHYQPLGPNDQCPAAPLSVALAIADKLDTLVGFFGIGEEPTGSKDPYALRRAALGIIRIIRENNIRDFSLQHLCEQATEAYEKQNVTLKPDCIEAVLAFINDRLKVALRGEGMRHDCVAAVVDRNKVDSKIDNSELLQSTELAIQDEYNEKRRNNIYSLSLRAKALQEFLESNQGPALSATFRRLDGIVEAETNKDKFFYLNINPDLLKEPQEKDLYQKLEDIIKVRKSLLDAHDYTGWMAQLASLRESVDAFFDTIKVNDENKELRANRLGLLSKLRIQIEFIGNFSKIEG